MFAVSLNGLNCTFLYVPVMMNNHYFIREEEKKKERRRRINNKRRERDTVLYVRYSGTAHNKVPGKCYRVPGTRIYRTCYELYKTRRGVKRVISITEKKKV